MARGIAVIDISVEALQVALANPPSTYKVIGSDSSIAPDTVRLILTSDDIADDCRVHMCCEIKDAGSTRTVRMVKVHIESRMEWLQ